MTVLNSESTSTSDERTKEGPAKPQDFPPLTAKVDVARQFAIDIFTDELYQQVAKHPSPFFADFEKVSPNERLDSGRQQKSGEATDETSNTSNFSVRYGIMERVAAGGMGVVYRAKDFRLNREVALKVISTECDDPTLLQRFLNESRVLAKLQHPYIPPVYEEGWLPDGRAYIAMKLVAGKTLAELLEERSSPDVDVVKYLGIFRQICETVAFAHANGFLHRDLKPQNVMIGEFGEVQVIDWGLAKRLDWQSNASDLEASRSSSPTHSIQEIDKACRLPGEELTMIGAVLGTPEYMSPEQANGFHYEVNEASDVFSLGGILFKILTGNELYVGDSAHDVYEAACLGELEEALVRLDECHADEVLKDLVKQCLHEHGFQRPQTAAEIVTILDEQLDSIQDRLWEIEIAHTQELEQNRRRRLMMALLTSACLFVVVIVSGWSYYSHSAAVRLRSEVESVSQLLGTAMNHRDVALEHPLEGAEDWLSARESIDKAFAIATHAGDDKLSGRVTALSAEIDDLSRLAEQDRDLITNLTAAASPVSLIEMRTQLKALGISRQIKPAYLHDGPGQFHPSPNESNPIGRRPRPFPPMRPFRHQLGPPSQRNRPSGHHADAIYGVLSDRYVIALADFGIDPRIVSAEHASEMLWRRPTRIRTEVVNAMHRWFGVLMKHPDNDQPRVQWVLNFLRNIDPDELRNNVRQRISDKDFESLGTDLSRMDLMNHPPSFLWLISQHFPEDEEGFEFLRRSRERYPGSLLLNQELAEYYYHSGQGLAAITAFMNVLAIKEDAHTYARIATCLMREGRLDDANMMCRNAIRLSPENCDAYPLLAHLLIRQGRYEEANAIFQDAESKLPEDSEVLKLLEIVFEQAVGGL